MFSWPTIVQAWKSFLAWIDSVLWAMLPVFLGLLVLAMLAQYSLYLDRLDFLSFTRQPSDRTLFYMLVLFLGWNVPRWVWKSWKWFHHDWSGKDE